MNKSGKLILAALVLLAAGSAALLLLRPAGEAHPTARITLDGELVREIDLTGVEEPFSFTVEGPAGLTNTILVEPGRIRVSEADCPDQICVHQGFISDGTTPIVCLPNKLIIQIIGGGEALDAAAG